MEPHIHRAPVGGQTAHRCRGARAQGTAVEDIGTAEAAPYPQPPLGHRRPVVRPGKLHITARQLGAGRRAGNLGIGDAATAGCGRILEINELPSA